MQAPMSLHGTAQRKQTLFQQTLIQDALLEGHHSLSLMTGMAMGYLIGTTSMMIMME